MQDDIADSTRWAIAQGIASPGRVCIAGASYGGYATLMGLVNDPELYKCGFAMMPVTDVHQLFAAAWHFVTDFADRYKQYPIATLVGEASQLAPVSPLVQAARIRQPLLMAAGGADQRVPLAQARQFSDAVKAANAQMQLLVYDDETHGLSMPKNRIDFWTRVEKFLDQHIGMP